jgi:hypothetical protein
MANTRRDFIEERLDNWIRFAEDLDYEIIAVEVETISHDRSLYFYLEPGIYHAYAEGGVRIEDLDMEVIDRRGREIASDFMSDNYPVVEFELWDGGEIEFRLNVFEFESRAGSGYYCFVLAREWGGWGYDDRRDRGYRDRYDDRDRHDDDYWDDRDDWNDRDDRRDRGRHGRDRRNDRDRDHDRGRDRDRDRWDDWDDWNRDDWDYDRDYDDDYRDDWYWDDWDDCYNDWEWRWDFDFGWDNDYSRNERRRIVENSLDDLYDFAWSRGHNPIMSELDEINDTRTFTMTLQRGYYTAFARGGPFIEDLDLSVSDGWRMLAEDTESDARPGVWFNVPNRTTVDFEVKVWSFMDWNDEDYFCLLVCEG